MVKIIIKKENSSSARLWPCITFNGPHKHRRSALMRKVETFHQLSNLNSKHLPEDIKVRYVPVSLDIDMLSPSLKEKKLWERDGRWESEIRCRHFC